MRRDSATSQNGLEFISCDALVFGDYGGAGSVGRANINFLKDEFKDRMDTGGFDLEQEDIPEDVMLYIAYGAYSSEQAWLRNTSENEEMLDELDDYPAFSDDYVSEVEMEWEEEAWESWAKDDLLRDIGDTPVTDPDQGVEVPLEELLEKLDDKERQALLWETYRAAMDETNTYPTPEYNGSHIDVDRIQDAFLKILVKKLTGPFPAQGQQKLPLGESHIPEDEEGMELCDSCGCDCEPYMRTNDGGGVCKSCYQNADDSWLEKNFDEELPLGESRMTEDECQSCGAKMTEDEGYEIWNADGGQEMWCEECTSGGAVECAACDRHLDASNLGPGDECPNCGEPLEAAFGWPQGHDEGDPDVANIEPDPDCEECGGNGLVDCEACYGEGYDNTDAKCDECWGTGQISCPSCYNNSPQEGSEDNFTDPEADADTLRSAGMGTDEDYGYYGSDD